MPRTPQQRAKKTMTNQNHALQARQKQLLATKTNRTQKAAEPVKERQKSRKNSEPVRRDERSHRDETQSSCNVQSLSC